MRALLAELIVKIICFSLIIGALGMIVGPWLFGVEISHLAERLPYIQVSIVAGIIVGVLATLWSFLRKPKD